MKNIFFLAVALVMFSACSSKSKFVPEKITSKIDYSSNLQSELVEVSREGATYANGMVVSNKRGLLKHRLEKGYHFVSDDGKAILVADANAHVKVLQDGKIRFEKEFDFALSSGSIKENLLALVFSNNTLMLYDMVQDKELYREDLEPTYANDSRLANPLFLNDLVIFPTLDGRLLMMDSIQKVILRDVAISDKALFNNVIFLEEEDNILVAATGSKVISINAETIETKRVDVKDVLYGDKNVYIFTKTGKILKCDSSLNVLKEVKFPFAIFSAVMNTDGIYVVEKSGYLIAMDKNLENSKTYALPSEINKPLFTFGNRLFFGKRFIKLH